MSLLDLLQIHPPKLYEQEMDGWINEASKNIHFDFRPLDPRTLAKAENRQESSPALKAVFDGFSAALQSMKASRLHWEEKKKVCFFLRQALPVIFREFFWKAPFFFAKHSNDDLAKVWMRTLYSMQLFLAEIALQEEERILGVPTAGVGVIPPPLVSLPVTLQDDPLPATDWLERKLRFSRPEVVAFREGGDSQKIACGFSFEEKFVILDRGERDIIIQEEKGQRWEVAALDQAGFFWPLPQGFFNITEKKSFGGVQTRKTVRPLFYTWTQAVYAVLSLVLGGYKPLIHAPQGDLGNLSPSEAKSQAEPVSKNASSIVLFNDLLEQAPQFGKRERGLPDVGNAWEARGLTALDRPRGNQHKRELVVESWIGKAQYAALSVLEKGAFFSKTPFVSRPEKKPFLETMKRCEAYFADDNPFLQRVLFDGKGYAVVTDGHGLAMIPTKHRKKETYQVTKEKNKFSYEKTREGFAEYEKLLPFFWGGAEPAQSSYKDHRKEYYYPVSVSAEGFSLAIRTLCEVATHFDLGGVKLDIDMKISSQLDRVKLTGYVRDEKGGWRGDTMYQTLTFRLGGEPLPPRANPDFLQKRGAEIFSSERRESLAEYEEGTLQISVLYEPDYLKRMIVGGDGAVLLILKNLPLFPFLMEREDGERHMIMPKRIDGVKTSLFLSDF